MILKRVTTALSKMFANEIVFPTDTEMSAMMYTLGQNKEFGVSVCAVDGTEIQISQPSHKETQRKTWSVKKHQNALNCMIMTKLNGEIIYFSPLSTSPHDQKQWNQLDLQSHFVGKRFGVLGDGGFCFNQKNEKEPIHGQKPVKKKKKGTLTSDEKYWNGKLSEMRVIVENSIRVVKVFKVVGSVYRHWRGGRGQINVDHVMQICVCLAN